MVYNEISKSKHFTQNDIEKLPKRQIEQGNCCLYCRSISLKRTIVHGNGTHKGKKDIVKRENGKGTITTVGNEMPSEREREEGHLFYYNVVKEIF